MDERRYAFSWDLLGDIERGRPNLGNSTRLEIYRLMQFTFRDVLEERYGTAEADLVFREAGGLAGRAFYDHLFSGTTDFQTFIRKLQEVFREMGIGVLRVEEADLAKSTFTITVSEDLDCSGLPELDYEVCTYDEGFIAALLEGFTGRPFTVREIDCWCTGDRTCRFSAEPAL
jgi:uncharacterized protein